MPDVDLKNLVSFLVENLVGHPDAATVNEEGSKQSPVFRVSVAPEDQGKIIGRHGRTIRAVRSLVNVAASRQGMRAAVEVVD